jgi:hypothetical protein
LVYSVCPMGIGIDREGEDHMYHCNIHRHHRSNQQHYLEVDVEIYISMNLDNETRMNDYILNRSGPSILYERNIFCIEFENLSIEMGFCFSIELLRTIKSSLPGKAHPSKIICSVM